MKNYYELQLKELNQISCQNKKPSLLLHTCCALCFSSVFMQIHDYFSITVYFFNPNIYPLEEYNKRKDSLLKLIDIFNNEFNSNIQFIEGSYDFNNYQENKIHHNKCLDCLNYRIENSFHFANQNGYDYITTTLTLGRLKNSFMINSIAENLQKQFSHTKYFYSDFKKNKGIDLSLSLKDKYNIYAQNYCGCEKFTLE